MFFRRQNGQYQETDRVTRFKLIKSGKRWLRAATSHFALFRVMRGGADVTEITPQIVDDQTVALKGEKFLKGVAATGAVLGGAAMTYTAQADDGSDQPALERAVTPEQDVLAASGTAVLGNSVTLS